MSSAKRMVTSSFYTEGLRVGLFMASIDWIMLKYRGGVLWGVRTIG